MIAAFPDGLTGQRIAGIAGKREAVQEALARLGHSPLVVDAFRQRRWPTPPARRRDRAWINGRLSEFGYGA
jgi:hypothetical protein